MANMLSTERRLKLLHLLCEGNSIRGTARLMDMEHRTVLRHLVIAGEQCRMFLHNHLQEIPATHVEIDEIWTFVACKQRRIAPEQRLANPHIGDQYLYLSLDQRSKLICNYAIGKREQSTTDRFIEDLARRIVVENRPQISTDGFKCYPDAIANSFGHQVDYGTIVKNYADGSEMTGRYAPPEVVGSDRKSQWGVQNLRTICTSHIERFNLSLRTFVKRFSRLSLGFSKKLTNLKAAVALHVFHYNFCRIHSSIRCTPAMRANLTDHIWKLDDLFGT